MRVLGVMTCLVLAAAMARQDVFRYDPAARVLETERSRVASTQPLKWSSPRHSEAESDGRLRLLDSLHHPQQGALAVRSAPDGDRLELDLDSWSLDAPAVAWTSIRGPVACIGDADFGGHEIGDNDPADPWLVVWDELNGSIDDGASFDVLASWRTGDEWSDPIVVAGGPRLQIRPSAVMESRDGAWIAWEEGPDGWGHEYRSVDRLWNNVVDHEGPLHSWREVHVAHLSRDGTVREVEVPMPSFEKQRREPNRRPGTERLGVFYEGPELGLDPRGAIWLAYRHMHQAQLSLEGKTQTHIERGYEVHLTRLEGAAWSEPMRLDVLQRDSDQGLEFRRIDGALVVHAQVGRLDRRGPSPRQGDVMTSLSLRELEGVDGAAIPFGPARRESAAAPIAPVRERPTFELAGEPHTLLFGDLHRHTDLSLCFPFYDGSLDTAYRYARGPAALDFFALTDHARDLARGDVNGELWKRTVAAADAHHVPGRFVAFYSYERSQGNTDHNVISLRPDVLRPHNPPLTEFWEEFGPNRTITIPHATAARPGARFCGDVWQKRDDHRRPIAEIYQSYRDVSSMGELQTAALNTGQRLGFIASSDHLATGSAYACVWAEGEGPAALDRQPIFDALRTRRTYGATARIELRVTSNDLWMGSVLPGDAPHPIDVHVQGTAPIDQVEYWSQGELVHAIPGEGKRLVECTWPWTPAADTENPYVFVRVLQKNGHRAWSSPFFKPE